jgi:hypothetical protein
MELTLSVRSFHVPATPRTSAWPPSLPFGAYFARHARHFGGERTELIDHGVDGVLQFENFAAHVDRDLAREVALGDGSGDFGDVTHLPRQVARHGVDASRSDPSRPATPFTSAWPPRIPSVPTSRATRVTSDANELS